MAAFVLTNKNPGMLHLLYSTIYGGEGTHCFKPSHSLRPDKNFTTYPEWLAGWLGGWVGGVF